jgi:hypothetical protein
LISLFAGIICLLLFFITRATIIIFFKTRRLLGSINKLVK